MTWEVHHHHHIHFAHDTDRERWEKEVVGTLHMITQQGARIMSAISDFAAKQDAFNTRIGTSIDNVVADIQTLNDLITQLQNSAGTVTPEDQALIDQLEAKGSELATKAEALDGLTPPKPPAG